MPLKVDLFIITRGYNQAQGVNDFLCSAYLIELANIVADWLSCKTEIHLA